MSHNIKSRPAPQHYTLSDPLNHASDVPTIYGTPGGCNEHGGSDREWRALVKAELIEAYGGRCNGCGSVEELQIDHVLGGGNAHRRWACGTRSKPGSHAFRLYLRRHGHPRSIDGHPLQLLCRPCHEFKTSQESRLRALYRRLHTPGATRAQN